MQYVHIARSPDGVNHGVVSMRSNIRANGRYHTICGHRVDDTFIIRPGNYPFTVMGCDTDIRFVAALADLDEKGL